MERATQSPAQVLSIVKRAQNESGFFSSESVLNILKLLLAGAELPEVLTIIARLVESQDNGTLCTIWLPDDDGKQLRCAAAPSLPGFSAHVGPMSVGPKGGSCGTAVYRREPVYVADILREPFGMTIVTFSCRTVFVQLGRDRCSRVKGSCSVPSRFFIAKCVSPDATDLQLIENASHIAGIAIERHISGEELRHERDRLQLLLELTNSTISKLDLPRLMEALSTNLLGVTRCDFCALVLPDADTGELRVTTLYNPRREVPFATGPLSRSAVRFVAKPSGLARLNILIALKTYATTLKASATASVGASTSGLWRKAWYRDAISRSAAEAAS